MWRYIKDTDNNFRVHDSGVIERKRNGVWEIVSCNKTGVGYYRAYITTVSNGRKSYMQHRIVAEAFLGVSKSKDAVDVHHIDHDKSNNALSNLDVMSHKENVDEYFENVYRKEYVPVVTKCSRCGVRISNRASMCEECSHKSSRITKRPDRDLLFYLLLCFNFTFVGNLYGVSDNAVRKWCVTEGIPNKSSYYQRCRLV